MTQRAFDFTLTSLLPLALETVRKPRPVVRQMIDLSLPTSQLWLILLTIATLSVVIGQGAALLLSPADQAIDGYFLANPLVMAGIQWGVLVVTLYAMHHIGALMGGRGAFADSLTALSWLQFVMLCVQVIQTALLFIAPGVAGLITLFAVILLLWLFTNFVAEVHGFENLALVFVMILVSTFAISFALTLLLTVSGVVVPGA